MKLVNFLDHPLKNQKCLHFHFQPEKGSNRIKASATDLSYFQSDPLENKLLDSELNADDMIEADTERAKM